MTVSTAYNGPQTSACDGSTTSFPVAFQYAAASELVVELVDDATGLSVALVEGTDYTRSGDGMSAPSGITTLTVYPAGKSLRRSRSTPLTQTLLAPPNSLPQSSLMERAWDRAVLALQEVAATVAAFGVRLGRTWQPPANSTYAGKYPVVGPNGELLYSSGTGSDGALRVDLAQEAGFLYVGGALGVRDTIAKVAALSSSVGITYLLAGGRSGFFRWVPGDQSAYVSADPLHGISIPPVSAPTGASGCWIRLWDGMHAKPEWFGAQPGLSSVDCAPAINACLAAAPITVLEAADYWVQSTVKVKRTGRALKGVSQHYTDGVGETSRILTASTTLNPIVQVGADSWPGNVNILPRGMKLEDVYVGRTVGPDKTVRPVGVSIQYVLGPEVRRVKSNDSTACFRLYGTVSPYLSNTNANRVADGTGTGTDFWDGYLLDGAAEIGLAGGNASVYFFETQAGCNNAALQNGLSYGYRLSGKFQDTFLDRIESVTCNVGIAIEGGAGSGDADIKISRPVMDAPFRWGIYAIDLSKDATVNIENPYVGNRPSTQFGIYFQNCIGSVNVFGGEVLAALGGQGIAIVSSVGISIDKTIIKDTSSVGVGVSGACKSLTITAKVHNPTIVASSAIRIEGTGLTSSVIAPVVYGQPAGFTVAGIEVVGAIDTKNKYELAGIDATSVSGGAVNKLIRNGSQVTATGPSGTNDVGGPI